MGRRPSAGRRGRPRANAALEDLWQQLAGGEAASREAVERLAKGGPETVVFLRDRLVRQVDEAAVNALVAQLDNDDFGTREATTQELIVLGPSIHGVLREHLTRDPPLETRLRLEGILTRGPSPSPPQPEGQQQVGAVTALQRIGTEEARAALKRVRDGSIWQTTAKAAADGFDRLTDQFITRCLDDARARAKAGDYDNAQALCRQAEAERAVVMLLGKERILQAAEWVEEHRRVSQEANDLAASLAAKPADATARNRLVRVLMVELDRPADAAKHVDESVEAELARMVRLAAELYDRTPAAQRLELADWYLKIASNSQVLGKTTAMARAQSLYEGTLQLAQLTDAERAAAGAGVQRVRLAAVGGLAGANGEGIDLLKLIDPRLHACTGQWQMTEAGLRCMPGNFYTTMVPVIPQGSYELRIQFLRTAGNDGIFIAVPVGERRGDLNLGGWGGTVSGLERIDGKAANENESTVRAGPIANGAVQTLVVRVVRAKEKVEVQVLLNEKPYISWSGDPRAPEHRSDVGVAARRHLRARGRPERYHFPEHTPAHVGRVGADRSVMPLLSACASLPLSL